MKISVETKENITKEIGDTINRKAVSELLDILEKLLDVDCPIEDLKGIKDTYSPALSRVFSSSLTIEDIVSDTAVFFKIEAILKLILYYANPDSYKNVGERDGLAKIIKSLKLNPDNINLDKALESYSDNMKPIASAYQLRNKESHAMVQRNRMMLYEKIHDVMFTILFCISIHMKELQNNLPQVSFDLSENNKISEYMDELIIGFKSKMKKYIELNGEENLKIADSKIFETNSGEKYSAAEDADEMDGLVQRNGSIDEIRKNNLPEKRMMIWGEAGTGKSTTLEYLAYEDAKAWKNDHKIIPVLIPLGLLLPNETIMDYISEKKLHLDEETIGILLKNGQLNIFIDGVNEIATNGSSNLKNQRLIELQRLLEYSENTFIISNRPNASGRFRNVPVFMIEKLSDNQIIEFLKKNTESKNTVKIIEQAFDEKPKLKSIVRTPLMFSRLIEIVEATGKIPESEGAIIGEFLNTLFERECNDKSDANCDTKQAKYLLRSIAYNGLEDASTNAGMTEETVLGYMKKCTDTYSFQVDYFYMLKIFKQLGILIKRDGLYVFVHQAYQDYYHALEENALLGLE